MSIRSVYYDPPEMVAAGPVGTWLHLGRFEDLHEEWEVAHKRAIEKGRHLYLIIAAFSHTVVVCVDEESEIEDPEQVCLLANCHWHRFVMLSEGEHLRALSATAGRQQGLVARARASA